MAVNQLKIYLAYENKGEIIDIQETTTAEDVCIRLCKKLGIGTVARHLFALRIHGKQIFLMPAAKFTDKNREFDLRIRFKVTSIPKLKKLDIDAYDYFFHQARLDVLENKIPDLVFENYRKELVGLGITDMYRVMVENDLPQETVEADYKKYIPKEVLKRHHFFVKKPIREGLNRIKKSQYDAWYVRGEYLKLLDRMVPEYLAEEYKAIMDNNVPIIIKASQFAEEPGINYMIQGKNDKWHNICSLDDIAFISIREDTVELSRKNGIPIYLRFGKEPEMYSFVSFVDGYYRLSVKWTFNLCRNVITPSLEKLYAMRCHGPVGGEYSYAKLEEKRNNQPGCYIIRESESRYNIYYVDVCLKNNLKPKTFKLERLRSNEFVFHDDLTKYPSIAALVAAYKDENGEIYLNECLPPSESDKSPLLLCARDNVSADVVTEASSIVLNDPVFISSQNILVFKDKKCLRWNKNRPKVKIPKEIVSINQYKSTFFPDETVGDAKKFCRNPDGDIGGPWCFVETLDKKIVEKQYCDIPYCHDETCMVFTKNQPIYSHYISFPNDLINFTFGIKLWDPDSYLNTTAKIILSLYALPLTSKQMDDLAIGVEVVISNKKTVIIGGVNEIEAVNTFGILKANKYVYFSLTWWHNIISLTVEGEKKPLLMADIKDKDTLLNYKMNQFFYFSSLGENIIWQFPFCDIEEHCDVHTTTSVNFQKFFPIRDVLKGQDINFNIRVHHSAYILLVATPALDYPQFKLILQRVGNVSRVLFKPFKKAPEEVIQEIFADNLLNYWKWKEFTINLFGDEFELSTSKKGLANVIISFKHEKIKLMRWFSISSDNTVAHWTFYCFPPKEANPPVAYLPECAITKSEIYYNGTQDVTSDGFPCLPWAGQKIMPEEINNLFKSVKEKLQASNYCRDPKDEQKGAFCYTINQGEIKKEYCRIRKCKSSECKMAGTGNDYIGRMSVTRTNRTCQHWLSPDQMRALIEASKSVETTSLNLQSDEINSINNLVKRLQSVNQYLDDNLCKDKWGCLKKLVRRRFVKKSVDNDVENDVNDVKNDVENSDKYVNESMNPPHESELMQLGIKLGNNKVVNQMVEEEETQTSVYDYPYIHTLAPVYLNETLYADMNLLAIKNYCRNPTRDVAGIWCFTTDPKVATDVCNVRDCDKPEECITIVMGGSEGADKKQNEDGVTLVYRCMWKHAKGRKIEVAMKTLKKEHRDRHLKDMLEAAGQWSLVQSSAIVRLFGVTVSGYLSMILEYIKYGPLDEYLKLNKNKLKEVDLIEASSNLAHALWHLEDIGIVHGKIRCKKLLVYNHDEREFKVKLALPSIKNYYEKEELHWIPIECYGKEDLAKASTAADVWAFGTTLWEIFSYGHKFQPIELNQMRMWYNSGKRLPQPHNCPKDIYELMLSCWERDPHHRKKPQSIVRDISHLMYQVYGSRRIHTYAQVNVPQRGISTTSLASASTVAMDELCKTESMSELSQDLLVTPNMNMVRREWHSEENMISFDTLSNDFSSILNSFTTSTTLTSGVTSMQSIIELDSDYNVIFQGRIGQGFYGEVYKGLLERNFESKIEPKHVAIKKLKKCAVSSSRQDFEREIEIMKALKHPNIVEILGVQNETEMLLVMEYIPHGSLQCYVKIHKERLTTKQLLYYALDIAKGMEYLGQKCIVHRDLAARNILVVDENHVKISDFGLAQFINTGDYYVLKTNRDLPIKWYAPESLKEGKFSTKSDVWSYGVTLWEMFSYGEEPKLAEEPKSQEPEQEFILNQLEGGVRYPCLPQFPRLTYIRVIHPCWAYNPKQRPTFSTICTNVEYEIQNETDI